MQSRFLILLLLVWAMCMQTSCRRFTGLRHVSPAGASEASQGEAASEVRVEIQQEELIDSTEVLAFSAIERGDIWREAVWVGEHESESRPLQLSAAHFIDRARPYRSKDNPQVVCFDVELNEDALYQRALGALDPRCKTSTDEPVMASVIAEHVEYITLWYRDSPVELSSVSVSVEMESTYSSSRVATRVGTLCCTLMHVRETLALTLSNDLYGSSDALWHLTFVWLLAADPDAPRFDSSNQK